MNTQEFFSESSGVRRIQPGQPEWECAGVYADSGMTGTRENGPDFPHVPGGAEGMFGV